MLYIGEGFLHVVVDPLGYLVGLPQGFFAVHLDFQVDVDLVAEHPGAERVHTDHALLPGDIIRHLLVIALAAGGIQQFDHAVLQDVIGCLDDEQADYHAGHRVEHRVSHHSAGNANQGTDGGKGVRAVVPGVRQKSRGMDQVGIIAGVPVHGLLAHDGDDGGHKSDGAGDSQGLVVAGENVLQPHLADPQPGAQQHDPQQQRGDTLDPFVAVGVGGVCLLFGGFDPDPGDQRGNYIGEGVDRVGDHRAGVAGDPGKEFEAGQNGVASHADKRHLPDGGGFIDGIFAGNCVGLLGGVFHGEILLFCVFRQKFLLQTHSENSRFPG